MKPIIQIWIPEKSLSQIHRGQYPSTWWRREPGDDTAICINVSSDWFVQMRDTEKELENDDLPFSYRLYGSRIFDSSTMDN